MKKASTSQGWWNKKFPFKYRKIACEIAGKHGGNAAWLWCWMYWRSAKNFEVVLDKFHMAGDVGMGKDTLYKWLKVLCDEHYLEKAGMRDAVGRFGVSVYKVRFGSAVAENRVDGSRSPCPKNPYTEEPNTENPDTLDYTYLDARNADVMRPSSVAPDQIAAKGLPLSEEESEEEGVPPSLASLTRPVVSLSKQTKKERRNEFGPSHYLGQEFLGASSVASAASLAGLGGQADSPGCEDPPTILEIEIARISVRQCFASRLDDEQVEAMVAEAIRAIRGIEAKGAPITLPNLWEWNRLHKMGKLVFSGMTQAANACCSENPAANVVEQMLNHDYVNCRKCGGRSFLGDCDEILSEAIYSACHLPDDFQCPHCEWNGSERTRWCFDCWHEANEPTDTPSALDSPDMIPGTLQDEPWDEKPGRKARRALLGHAIDMYNQWLAAPVEGSRITSAELGWWAHEGDLHTIIWLAALNRDARTKDYFPSAKSVTPRFTNPRIYLERAHSKAVERRKLSISLLPQGA